jgi:GntR family transcriptional regulator
VSDGDPPPLVVAAPDPLGPAAEDVRRRLLERIRSGVLRGGERLGAERDLAVEYGVSRSTLRQALSALEGQGFLRRTPGRGGGTFVTAAKVSRDLSRIVGMPALLRDQGFLAGTRVLSAAVVAADAGTAQALHVEPGAYVHDVVRIRLADGEPISLEHARFPASRFPDLLDHSLGGSLYELLAARYGVEPAEAEERIEVVAAPQEEAAVLGIPAGAALLSITRVTRDADGTPLEFSHDLFRADRTAITVRTRGTLGTALSPGTRARGLGGGRAGASGAAVVLP